MACPQLQIARPVIAPDEVAVMHRLTGTERPANHLRHDPDVLGDPAAPPLGVRVARGRAFDPHVALGIDPTAPADGPQRLALALLIQLSAAQTLAMVLAVTAWKVAAGLPAPMWPPQRCQLLALVELPQVTGAQAPRPPVVGTAVELTGIVVARHGRDALIEQQFEQGRLVAGFPLRYTHPPRACSSARRERHAPDVEVAGSSPVRRTQPTPRTHRRRKTGITANGQVKGPVLCSAGPPRHDLPARFCQVVPACPTLASWS